MNPRTTRIALASTVAGLLATGTALSQTAKSWKDIKAPALKSFDIAVPERHELPNGIVVLLMEDHELPLINMSARIRTGGRLAPRDKAGLADIFGGAWRTGGTKAKTGDQLDDFLEAHAAKVETSMGLDSATISLDCLKQDFPDVLAVFVDVLQNPAFRQDKIDLAKKQVNTQISRRNDSPDDILFREGTKLGYGADSPYAEVPEYATVAGITQDDLIAWHKKYVMPNRTIIGVEGDFDGKTMMAALEKALGSWPKGPDFKDADAAQAEKGSGGVYLVDKNDVTQASILLVHPGIRRDNPDLYAVDVLNEVMSGSFASRLFSNVRSKKGLAYSVWSNIGAGYDHPGLVMVSMATKNPTTVAGIEALYEEIDGVTGAVPVTGEELTRAKESILNSFIFRFDTKGKVLNQQMTYAYFGYPADFLTKYRAGIEKVSVDDVNRVAKSYLHKDQLSVMVVGKASEFGTPLDKLGKVTPVDITIPQPEGPKKAAATAESGAKGKALLAKVVEANGGKAKIAAVKDLQSRGTIKMKTPMGDMEGAFSTWLVLPDKLRVETKIPQGTMTMVVSPSAAWMTMGPNGMDLQGTQRDEQMNELKRSPLAILQHAEDGKLTVNHAGTEKAGGVDAELLDVAYDGIEVRLFVDPATHRIVRSAYRGMGQQGPEDDATDFSDYKEVGGIWLAMTEQSSQNGEVGQTVKIQEYKINAGVDPKMFEKPAAPAP
ncbi:MAG: insulinase family protein [Acidobacteriota bacterium]